MINIYLLIIMEAVIIHLCTHLLLPLNLKISTKLKLIAHPNERKIHKIPIPEAGGLCFALPIILAQATFGLISGNSELGNMLLELSGVGVLALCFGVWDDRFESPPPYKLLWQITLGIIMYLFGYRVLYLTNPFGEHFILGWLSFPVTVLWYLIVINAINFIDGIDGLACGITIIVSAVLMVIGIKEQNQLVIVISSFLLAGNLAFLRYNFYPAKIFMGETGSLFIGLNIAAISTAGTSQFKGITSITLMVPLTVMAVPIIDFVLAFFRRLHYGDMFHSDKEHIHHTMLDFGFSQRAIAIIIYLVTLLFGLIAIGFSFSSKKIVFSLLLGLFALMVVIAYLIMRQERKK